MSNIYHEIEGFLKDWVNHDPNTQERKVGDYQSARKQLIQEKLIALEVNKGKSVIVAKPDSKPRKRDYRRKRNIIGK